MVKRIQTIVDVKLSRNLCERICFNKTGAHHTIDDTTMVRWGLATSERGGYGTAAVHPRQSWPKQAKQNGDKTSKQADKNI